jgi:hypothetical protein
MRTAICIVTLFMNVETVTGIAYVHITEILFQLEDRPEFSIGKVGIQEW